MSPIASRPFILAFIQKLHRVASPWTIFTSVMATSPSIPDTSVPSYARPPIASLSHRHAAAPAPRAGGSAQAALATPRSDVLPEKPGLLRYRLSTFTSRGRANCSAPFRFLDLPPELRNRVYDCWNSDEIHKLDLTRFHRRHSTGLPALLRASRQLRKEAASFYFASPFDILAHVDEISRAFREFCTFMCLRFRSLMAADPSVTLLIVHDCTYHFGGYCSLDSGTRVRLAHVWPKERARPQMERMALAQWSVTSICPSFVSRWRQKRGVVQVRHSESYEDGTVDVRRGVTFGEQSMNDLGEAAKIVLKIIRYRQA